jgi:drug/metabolite transporter (DMT)-like permease
MRLRLLADLARSPAAVGGVGALIVGVALQATALHGAPLTLVEPILVAELPFALLIAGLLFGEGLDGRTWLALLLTSGALALLLWSASPSGGSVHRASALAWGASLAATAALVAILLSIASPIRGGARAALLGVAAGAGHGLSATLMKATTVAGADGAASLFGAWQLYAMVATGAGSVYLFQNALQAGPLAAAQPALSISDPAMSACFGMLLFGERVRGGPYVIAQATCMLVLALGLNMLARSPSATAARPRTRVEVPCG